jgi:hypothetical protein
MSDTTPHPLETEHEAKTQILPSQFELATLAAALDSPDKTPDATAERALAVWQACEKALELSSKREKYDRIRMEKLARFRKSILRTEENFKNGKIIKSEIGSVPLMDFLKQHFAKNSKPEHMLKKFRDFLREIVPEIEDDEETSFRKVARSMQECREKGFQIEIAAMLSDDFEEFLQRQKAEIKVERARKGGIARREKAEKSPQKTPQRKKPLAAKNPAPSKRKPGASSKAGARSIAGE